MIAIQLDFTKTEEECEIECLRKELDFTYKRLEAVRKGTYARLNDQAKEIEELKIRQNIIERNICIGTFYEKL
jgi:capsule polysaccharide export protein KpsE/RkpR